MKFQKRVSRILSTGGRGSPGPHPRGKLRGLANGGGLQAHTRGVPRPIWGGVSQHALRQTPPVDGYCCRQYASYWNAFLFNDQL